MAGWGLGRASRIALVVALITSIGTVVAARAALPSNTAPLACHSEWPVVAHHPGGQVVDPTVGSTLPVACAAETGYATSETTLALGNDGAVFFSPANSENSLARWSVGDTKWSLIEPATMQYTSLWNTVDPQVVVDRRTGRVFWVHATGDLRTAPVVVDESPSWQLATAVAYAHGFQVYSSADDGTT